LRQLVCRFGELKLSVDEKPDAFHQVAPWSRAAVALVTRYPAASALAQKTFATRAVTRISATL
jgi:hypothetical protein